MQRKSHLRGRRPRWDVLFPVGGWWHRVNGDSLRADLFAAFTNAAIVLPQGVAFAAIAGLPPEYGLYSAMIPTMLAALFGSSMVMVSGPTTAISAVVFSALSGHYELGSQEFVSAAILLTLMVGVIQLGLALGRAGKLAGFVSNSVMLGFTMAAAVLIFVSQLKDALGLELERGGSVFERLRRVVEHSSEINPDTVIIAATTFLTAYLITKFARRLPAFLIALVAGTLCAQFFFSGADIRTIGEINAILPKPSVPSFGVSDVVALLEPAFAVAVIGLLEALAIGRSFAPRTGTKFFANQEVYGQGIANFVGSFFQAYPSSGSFTRSGVNFASGAVTPMAAVFSGFFLILILLLVAPLMKFVPIAAMAGLIFLVAIRLINIGQIKHILQTSRTEVVILTATFLTGVVIELELALLLGVMLSFGSFVYRTARPALQVEAPDPMLAGSVFRDSEEFGLPECPQLMTTRFDGPMYFGSSEYLEHEFERLRLERPDQKHLIVNLKGTGDIDLAGVDALIEEAEIRDQTGGGLYVIARSIKLIARLEHLGLIRTIHGSHLFENKHDAIGMLVPRLDLDICAGCTGPIFSECARNKQKAAARVTPQDNA